MLCGPRLWMSPPLPSFPRSWYFSMHIGCVLLAVALPVKPRHLRLKEQQKSLHQVPVLSHMGPTDSNHIQKTKTTWARPACAPQRLAQGREANTVLHPLIKNEREGERDGAKEKNQMMAKELSFVSVLAVGLSFSLMALTLSSMDRGSRLSTRPYCVMACPARMCQIGMPVLYCIWKYANCLIPFFLPVFQLLCILMSQGNCSKLFSHCSWVSFTLGSGERRREY